MTSENHLAKTVLLVTIMLVGCITLIAEGVPLLMLGLIAAFLLTAKAKSAR